MSTREATEKLLHDYSVEMRNLKEAIRNLDKNNPNYRSTHAYLNNKRYELSNKYGALKQFKENCLN